MMPRTGDPRSLGEAHLVGIHAAPILAAFAAGWLLLFALMPFDQSLVMRINNLATAIIALGLCWWWTWTGANTPRWLLAAVGIWLLFAPLVFWAPRPLSCLGDLAAGTLLITASAILPTIAPRDDGNEVPPGWDYNPSTWSQRFPIAALALLGFAMASWLAAFQLGYVSQAWDPLFGTGTERVLTSDISHWFPVSAAGLGAIAYLVEVITCFIGDHRRWRTMPWVVLLFGLMIIPTGAVSIVLGVLQPIVVGSWCFLCLATAVVMLLMVSPALDEVVASWQHLRRCHRRGERWWKVLWHGSTESAQVPPTPRLTGQDQGMWPWHLLGAAGAGAWLMGAPYLTGMAGTTAGANQHLTGALVVTVAVIALGDMARPLRWLLVPLGLWLVLGAWLLPGTTGAGAWTSLAMGILLLPCAAIRGRIHSRFSNGSLQGAVSAREE